MTDGEVLWVLIFRGPKFNLDILTCSLVTPFVVRRLGLINLQTLIIVPNRILLFEHVNSTQLVNVLYWICCKIDLRNLMIHKTEIAFVSFSFLEFTIASIQKTLILSHKFSSGIQGPVIAGPQASYVGQLQLSPPHYKPYGPCSSHVGLYLEYYFISLLHSLLILLPVPKMFTSHSLYLT